MESVKQPNLFAGKRHCRYIGGRQIQLWGGDDDRLHHWNWDKCVLCGTCWCCAKMGGANAQIRRDGKNSGTVRKFCSLSCFFLSKSGASVLVTWFVGLWPNWAHCNSSFLKFLVPSRVLECLPLWHPYWILGESGLQNSSSSWKNSSNLRTETKLACIVGPLWHSLSAFDLSYWLYLKICMGIIIERNLNIHFHSRGACRYWLPRVLEFGENEVLTEL